MAKASSSIASPAHSDKGRAANVPLTATAAPAKGQPGTNKPAMRPEVRQAAAEAKKAVIGFGTAALLCPDAGQAAAISRAYPLEDVNYHGIREATEEHVARSAAALTPVLSDKAIELHLQRIVDAFVRSAHGAGTFYQTKASLARELNSKITNEDRDEDRMGVDGMANRAGRAREFAAQMALQSFALLAAAEGAVDAYAQVTGNTWKPYEGSGRGARSLDQQAAAEQMAALGM